MPTRWAGAGPAGAAWNRSLMARTQILSTNASAATARLKIPTTSSPNRSEASNEGLIQKAHSNEAPSRGANSSEPCGKNAKSAFFNFVCVRAGRERSVLRLSQRQPRRATCCHRQRKRVAESRSAKRPAGESVEMARHHIFHRSALLADVDAL